MTYEKCRYDIPPYQEGNVCDFEFDVDENFPIDQVSDITLQVRDSKGYIVIEKKKLSEGTILLSDRTVHIDFLPADTLNRSGQHQYEIDFINLQNQPFATMGGSFTINKQVNTL